MRWIPRCAGSFTCRGSRLMAVCLAPLALITCHSFAGTRLDSLADNALRIALRHLELSVTEVGDSSLYPTHATPGLKWKLRKADDWTAGFYAGCLWYAYEASRDHKFEAWARRWTESLDKEKDNPSTHDLGFKMFCSYGNGLRLMGAAAPKDYKAILLESALTLSRRYSPVVGCFSSNWDRVQDENSFPVIIDIMMNLELLNWASENGGPSYYADYARSHALAACRDLVRPDGSTYHVVRYDKRTGKIISKGTLQGEGNETTWSRGNAWGLYGMVMMYRYTKDSRFLETAIRIADYFIAHLAPDHVAPWDFNSGLDYRDASATSIATSALFEMVKYVEDPAAKTHYRETAEAMLSTLCCVPYFLPSDTTSCILDHSVQDLATDSNVDVPNIFADYYFLEALLRYREGRTGKQ